MRRRTDSVLGKRLNPEKSLFEKQEASILKQPSTSTCEPAPATLPYFSECEIFVFILFTREYPNLKRHGII